MQTLVELDFTSPYSNPVTLIDQLPISCQSSGSFSESHSRLDSLLVSASESLSTYPFVVVFLHYRGVLTYTKTPPT